MQILDIRIRDSDCCVDWEQETVACSQFCLHGKQKDIKKIKQTRVRIKIYTLLNNYSSHFSSKTTQDWQSVSCSGRSLQ